MVSDHSAHRSREDIVAVKKPTADLPKVLGRKEELACEIISHFCCDAHAKVNLFAFEADSNLATLALLDKSAIASIEIDDVSEKQWEKENLIFTSES